MRIGHYRTRYAHANSRASNSNVEGFQGKKHRPSGSNHHTTLLSLPYEHLPWCMHQLKLQPGLIILVKIAGMQVSNESLQLNSTAQ